MYYLPHCIPCPLLCEYDLARPGHPLLSPRTFQEVDNGTTSYEEGYQRPFEAIYEVVNDRTVPVSCISLRCETTIEFAGLRSHAATNARDARNHQHMAWPTQNKLNRRQCPLHLLTWHSSMIAPSPGTTDSQQEPPPQRPMPMTVNIDISSHKV